MGVSAFDVIAIIRLSIWGRAGGIGGIPGIRGIRGIPGNGVTDRRTEPGNRAHAFRMTFVAQGKLPQITRIRWLCLWLRLHIN